MTETMTYHCRVERADRVNWIIKEIGLGQIVKEKYGNINGKAATYTCITDTGVTIIKTGDKKAIITMYITTARELVAVYGGQKKIPLALRKKVDHNQSKYIRNGKTVWA